MKCTARLKMIGVWLSLSMLFATGCSLVEGPEPLAMGKYEAQVPEMEFLKPWVSLEADNKFEFNRGGVLSYRPSGTYSIEKDMLVLTANVNEIYKFKIKGKSFIFESGAMAERFTREGTVFELIKTK